MKKTFTTIASLALAMQIALAGNITGKVIDASTKTPLDFVNVALFADGNTVPLTGATTDGAGAFSFENLKKGTYTVRITFMGYDTVELPISVASANSVANLGAISLSEGAVKLSEVEVVGQRSQMRFEVDKKVFSVDESISSAGGSASEVLQNIPSVDVDIEGNISLRNDASVEVWINGRPSGLTADNRAQILEQMPAESIENIEVITNPSARFSAEGSAGIINLVLKKERKAGYYGSVTGGANTQGGYNGSASINYNASKVDAYASMGIRKMRHDRISETDQLSWEDNDTTRLLQLSDGEMVGMGYFLRSGVGYQFTDKDRLGFTLSAMIGDRAHLNVLDSYDETDALTSTRDAVDDSGHNTLDLGIDYTHTFSSTSELRANLTFDQMSFYKSEEFDETFADLSTTSELQEEDTDMVKWEAQVDYNVNLSDNIKLEAGYKGLFTFRDSETRNYEDNELLLTDPFDYNKHTQALYATVGGKLGNFGFQAGLRGEYLTYDILTLIEGEEVDSKEYLDLFPSLFLNYSLPEGNEVQLNYTRRINSPNGRTISPFKGMINPYSVTYGNAELDPEYTNSMELNYIKNWEAHTVSASVYYRSTYNMIQQVSYYVDPTLYTTYENIAKSQRSGVEFVAKNRLFSVLDLTTTLNGYYYVLDGFTYDYTYLGASDVTVSEGSNTFSWDARIMAAVALPYGISAQATGGYRSKSIVAQGESAASYSLDMGVRKSFFNRKLSLSLTGRDLLNSRTRSSITYGDDFYKDSYSKFGQRTFMLTASYLFGNSNPKKNANRGDGSESGMSEMMDY